MPAAQSTKKSKSYAAGNTGLGTINKPSKRARDAIMKTAGAMPSNPFIRGSLNDQLSRLAVGKSIGEANRMTLDQSYQKDGPKRSQKWFKDRNSAISGAIAKVRNVTAHKSKRFTMERGSYTTSSNDAIIFFICITRTE